jgi:hypothetical protein
MFTVTMDRTIKPDAQVFEDTDDEKKPTRP